ncbi:class I SAM-dependent methyltransferase [Luteimonas chenhongjianii]|nr:class I SAM-dependent methyltransferase [Luteimonas chenhongjianii]
MSDAVSSLREAFERTRLGSKHACYQEIPALLWPHLADSTLPVLRRYEAARLRYVLDRIDMDGQSVLDIGSNGGFFLMEMLRLGASHATAYEGSPDHAAFLNAARGVLGLDARMDVHARYFDFECERGHYDVALLLNVLHHVGDDYGDKALSVNDARGEIIRSLRRMREHCDTLVFQLGYNWKGDRDAGMFEHGTIDEMVAFVESGIDGAWRVRQVGVAERDTSGEIVYRDLCDGNRHRKDDLGEFLNRPIFLLA